MNAAFQVLGKNSNALFRLTVHRGDGMVLLAMDWKKGKPPTDFVGFAIEYQEPDNPKVFPLPNRIAFAGPMGEVNPKTLSSRLSPIQKFRWVHFPRNASLEGDFIYRVIPVFMDANDKLTYGEPQEVAIELRRETHPKKLNISFTRGFVSSQAFVDRIKGAEKMKDLLPAKAADGLDFQPKLRGAESHLEWMGFEAREMLLEVLDQAIADPAAQVRVIAYDLNEPNILKRLEALKDRLKIIIDDSDDHGEPNSPETRAAARLQASAGAANVKRQHMGTLQHNKTIIVDSPKTKMVVAGSTNFSWRGLYVQNNNALQFFGAEPVRLFTAAFDGYWQSNKVADFDKLPVSKWQDLGVLKDGATKVAFSPRGKSNSLLEEVAADISGKTESSLLFSLAFLAQTKGAIPDALAKLKSEQKVFCYGIADKKVTDLNGAAALTVALQKPTGSMIVVNPTALTENLPEPFRPEPTGGNVGTRLHHKFVVIDFDKPTARVYTGSYNFSATADSKNGENLICIRDRRVATAYMIEALRIFDHYHFRIAVAQSQQQHKPLQLKKPPRKPGEVAWWDEYFTDPIKKRDRELFC